MNLFVEAKYCQQIRLWGQLQWKNISGIIYLLSIINYIISKEHFFSPWPPSYDSVQTFKFQQNNLTTAMAHVLTLTKSTILFVKIKTICTSVIIQVICRRLSFQINPDLSYLHRSFTFLRRFNHRASSNKRCALKRVLCPQLHSLVLPDDIKQKECIYFTRIELEVGLFLFLSTIIN